MFASIDPGKFSIALAMWTRSGILSSVDFLRFKSFQDLAFWCYERVRVFQFLVIEKPQVYQYSQRGRKDPNDLIDVAKTVGVCHLLALTTIEVKPREWKGQLTKKVSHQRIKENLAKEEIDVLGKKYQNHKDVLDAVGIGLRYFKRM